MQPDTQRPQEEVMELLLPAWGRVGGTYNPQLQMASARARVCKKRGLAHMLDAQ